MILAFDTSCYTTSIALMSADGRLIAEKRRLLSVPQGQSGLRQSEALFQHIKALPALAEELLAGREQICLRAVAASTRPRPRDGSYMPVFLAGEEAARLLALSHACPFYSFSHQEGHIMAALFSLGLSWQEPFLAAHLSGGTSEILRVTPSPDGFDVEIIGASDLPAGQFVDRVGTALGLPFPAGPHLEKLALSAPPAPLRLHGSVRGANISFSGPESAAQRLIAQGAPGQDLAQAVFHNIGKSLGKALKTAAEQTGCARVLIAGGVAANSLVREDVLAQARALDVHFAAPAYSGDNAVGIAALAAARLAKECAI